MIAVILAAGYATRLYPLTENKPKCLLEVGGSTILDRILKQLDEISGLERLVVVTNHRFYSQLVSWKSTAYLKVPIEILDDGTTSNDNRLGAVGDLGLAIDRAQISSDILLLASDNLFEQSLAQFADKAALQKEAVSIGVYDLGSSDLAAKKYGVIEAAASGEVLSFEEKPEKPKSSLIGMGVYYLPVATLGWVREYLKQKDAQDAPGFYIRWLLGKVKIFSLKFSGLWYDIGDFKSLDEADQYFRLKK